MFFQADSKYFVFSLTIFDSDLYSFSLCTVKRNPKKTTLNYTSFLLCLQPKWYHCVLSLTEFKEVVHHLNPPGPGYIKGQVVSNGDSITSWDFVLNYGGCLVLELFNTLPKPLWLILFN